MPSEQIVNIALILLNLSISLIMLLFAYQKMPQQFQKNFNEMQLISNKALKILSYIFIAGVFVQIYKHFINYM